MLKNRLMNLNKGKIYINYEILSDSIYSRESVVCYTLWFTFLNTSPKGDENNKTEKNKYII